MKGNRFPLTVLLLLSATAFQLPAQQTDAVTKLFNESKAKAEKGDPQSQYLIAACFQYGNGVMRDVTEAAKWYRKAAEQNFTFAQYSLGLCYANGDGLPKDQAEAVKWYRKAADNSYASAQCMLGFCYANGEGVVKDEAVGAKWYRKAAEQNNASAQNNLGLCLVNGRGVTKDEVEAVKWFLSAARQDHAQAQYNLGFSYHTGRGVQKNEAEAVKWYREAADLNDGMAQNNLGYCYANGDGIAKDYVEAFKWWMLAAKQGIVPASNGIAKLEARMNPGQVTEGRKLANSFKPRVAIVSAADTLIGSGGIAACKSFGTGFAITDDGYLVTDEHVVRNASVIRVVSGNRMILTKVVKADATTGLALLKLALPNAAWILRALPVVPSSGVKLGMRVASAGFPNAGESDFRPKLAKGEIASLSGAGHDARHFQISVPVQPGNSGGALVDERGNVVGVVSAKLSARAALAASGALPENVNYAVKSSYLLGFLESVPEVSAKLKEANTKEKRFEDVVKEAEQAAVLVLVY